MRRESHVRSGGRAGENHRSKDRQGAPTGPYTEHPTDEGGVYVAVVIDAWNGQVIGYSIADHLHAEPVVDALDMACWRRSRHPSQAQAVVATVPCWMDRRCSSRASAGVRQARVLRGRVFRGDGVDVVAAVPGCSRITAPVADGGDMDITFHRLDSGVRQTGGTA